MIETTHIPLAKAAEMLGADETTLLIAAVERRLQLYSILNKTLNVSYGKRGVPDIAIEGKKWRSFMFVEIAPYMAASIMQGLGGEYAIFCDGEQFFITSEGDEILIPADRNLVFAKREDIQAIVSNGLPKENTIPDAPANVPSGPRDSTVLKTVAAMLSAWPKGKIPSGKELEKAAQSVDVNVSDDSILKVINLAKGIGKFPTK